jgi:putative membrane protein
MWLDAFLAWLHYSAIFFLVGFLAVELLLIRGPLEARWIRLLVKLDIALAISAMAVLVSGFLRLVYGAKGPHFYLDHWPFYVKLGLFLAVGFISIKPTLAFIRWRRMLDRDARYVVPDSERLRVRRVILLEVHLAAMIPVFAVVMSRGLGQ